VNICICKEKAADIQVNISIEQYFGKKMSIEQYYRSKCPIVRDIKAAQIGN
jgi:hypothetical protein